MKRRRFDILTLFIVTVVTVLIWMLAEARTRDSATVPATIEFGVPGQANFVVSPSQLGVNIGLEGPTEAVRRMRRLLSTASLSIPVRAQPGTQPVDDLAIAIAALDPVRSTGVTIVSVDPALTEVFVEELVTRTASVRAVLSSASTVEDVTMTPESIEVTLPSAEAARLPEPLTVEAIVDQRDVERLEPGVLHSVTGTVRLPRSLGRFDSVTFEPATVNISFRLVSRVRTIDLVQVRVQINSAAQDFGQYRISLPEQFLHDVQIEADSDVVTRLEQGDGHVVAVVYLSTNDKERGITEKPVAFFIALFPDGSAEPVLATVDGDPQPVVLLQITPLVSE